MRTYQQKRQRATQGLLIIVGLSVLAGCGTRETSSDMKGEALSSMHSVPTIGASVSATSMTAAMPRAAGKAAFVDRASPNIPAAEKDKGKLTLVSLTDSQPDRYLIKNATVSIEASDARKVAESLIAYARVSHGYVSDSHETVDALGAHSITLQLRVPALQFEQSMQRIETLGKILDKQVTTEDVTEEFVDSTARVRNLKSTELRLLAHLSKTGKLSDTLLIETELTRVRQEIEQIEGRLKFLSHRVAYSTFALTVQETPKMQTIVPAQTFSSGKIASDAARSLIEFGQNLWSVVIWIGIWSAVWLPGIFLARAMYLRRKHPAGK